MHTGRTKREKKLISSGLMFPNRIKVHHHENLQFQLFKDLIVVCTTAKEFLWWHVHLHFVMCCRLQIISDMFIRKTCPCNVYPLKPHFSIVKLGYTRRGGSNVYPQSMFLGKIRKISKFFYQKFLFFTTLKISV